MLSNLVIADTDAVPLVATLIDFLGPGGIERKFDQLVRAFSMPPRCSRSIGHVLKAGLGWV